MSALLSAEVKRSRAGNLVSKGTRGSGHTGNCSIVGRGGVCELPLDLANPRSLSSHLER